MAKETAILSKIRALEKLAESGLGDNLMKQTVEKLIQSEEQRHRKDLKEIREKLNSFEKRFNMDSAFFHQKFHQGELGDAEDFFEWDALFEMEKRIMSRLRILCSSEI